MDETHIGPTTYSVCYADVLVTSRKHKKETSKDHRMIEICQLLKGFYAESWFGEWKEEYRLVPPATS